MKVYSYDESGLYTGESEAQKDQLTRGKDSFIVPANATKVKPPKFDDDLEIPKWNGTSWVLDESPKIKEKKKKDEEKAKEVAEQKAKEDAIKEMDEKNKKEQEQFASEFGAFVKKFRKDLKGAKNLDDLKVLVETLFNSVTKTSPE